MQPFLLSLLLPLSLLGLPGCGEAPDTDSATVSGEPPPPGVASDDWLRVVQPRIAAEGRAFHLREGDLRAWLPALGLRLEARDEGLSVLDAAGEERLLLRTARWGRADDLQDADLGPAELGGCSAQQGADGRCVQRLERPGAGLTEWWVGLETGAEQGWTVQTSPEGDGPLLVEVALDGALSVQVSDEEATVLDAAGGLWTVAEVAAVDARGRSLPAWLEPGPEGLRVAVDDAGAAYPVEIDPVYTTAAWTAEGTIQYTLGRVVAAAGDVNGDGYDDVVIGDEEAGGEGRAWVFHGSSSGVSDVASTTLSGEAADSAFGSSASGAGDVNGDGYDDVVVGADGYDSGTGRAYVYHGSSSGLASAAATTLDGASAGDALGASVSGAGDVNGDGYDDVVVGASGYNLSTGRVYVFHGSSSALASVASAMWTGEGLGNRFGVSVSGAGDLDGDGYDDLAVGASGYAASTGRVYVYQGSSSGLSGAPSTTLTGVGVATFFGASVSGAGDVNGDGLADLVVGAYHRDISIIRAYVYHGSSSGLPDTVATAHTEDVTSAGGGVMVSTAGDVNGDGYADVVVGTGGYSSDTGRVYLYRGSSSGLSETASTTLTGEARSDFFGASVAGAGDVNGDGYADVVVGAYGHDSDAGRVYMYHGTPSDLSDTASTTLDGAAAPTTLGTSVSGAGDVNGDGYDDVVIGAPGYRSSTGRAYVYLGSSLGLSDAASTTLTGETTDSYFGSSVSGVGDVNGDGYGDVVVGAEGYSSGAGRAYVYIGGSSGLSAAASLTLTGAENSAMGCAVSGAGDVDGDGYDDVVIGASGYDTSTGRAYLYRGVSTGLSDEPSTTLTGETGFSGFGFSVSGAGDVDGDGYHDVVVGAPGYNVGWGRAYLYMGTSSGISEEAAVTLTGEAFGDYFGVSVAGAGDVNGDGYSDLVVGAYGYGAFDGRAYLYHGASSGLSTAASTVLDGESTYNYFGRSVSRAGDVNGDGYDDVLVGADGYRSDTGRVYLYQGSLSGLSTTASTVLTGAAMDDEVGMAVSWGGDVNGDGYDDVLVGAPGDDSRAGRAVLYLGYIDADHDGLSAVEDCDDDDASIGGPETHFVDADGDGYGSTSTGSFCLSDPGHAELSTDCDDEDMDVNPSAEEVCNGKDDDCDGGTDVGATDAVDWYADLDADGFGDPAVTIRACSPPDGYGGASAEWDCDDGDAAVYPGATEVRDDGIDQDCDGADETTPEDTGGGTDGGSTDGGGTDGGDTDGGGTDGGGADGGGTDGGRPARDDDDDTKDGCGGGCQSGPGGGLTLAGPALLALLRRRRG